MPETPAELDATIATALNDELATQQQTEYHAIGPRKPSTETIGLASSAAPGSDFEAPGSCIGPYKLLQLIGEGGMGAVYLAEQERPVRRQVALKIIKPGMDSAQVI